MTMATTVRHVFFVIVGIFAILITWPFAFDWMRAGGNILNPVQFFADALAPGGTAAFLALDMAVAWAVFMVLIGRASCRERGWRYVWISVGAVSLQTKKITTNERK